MSFKETELGRFPDGWEIDTMENVLESIIDYRGKTPQKSEKGILTLSAKSVKTGFIDYSNAYCISAETYKKFMVRGMPKIGDILMTTEAPLGCIAKLVDHSLISSNYFIHFVSPSEDNRVLV